jgi:hypothetical protein
MPWILWLGEKLHLTDNKENAAIRTSYYNSIDSLKSKYSDIKESGQEIILFPEFNLVKV